VAAGIPHGGGDIYDVNCVVNGNMVVWTKYMIVYCLILGNKDTDRFESQIDCGC
jgi:hypothetical protein